jgi:hypothetical protein
MNKPTTRHHKKSPARQATSKRQLMASTARCRPLDPLPPQGEAGHRLKADPHQQYEDMARQREKTTDNPLPPELQSSCRKSAPRPPPEDAAPDRSHDRLIRKAETQQLMGNCSHMHLKRLVANTASGFPQPIYQGRIPHWWRGDIVRWIDRLARQPHGRPPQADNFAKVHARRRAAQSSGTS